MGYQDNVELLNGILAALENGELTTEEETGALVQKQESGDNDFTDKIAAYNAALILTVLLNTEPTLL